MPPSEPRSPAYEGTAQAPRRIIRLTAWLGLGIIGGFAWHGGTASSKARQRIVDLEPGELLLGPYVVVRGHSLRFVEAPHGDLHPIAEHVFMHGKRASTNLAKPALGVLR